MPPGWGCCVWWRSARSIRQPTPRSWDWWCQDHILRTLEWKLILVFHHNKDRLTIWKEFHHNESFTPLQIQETSNIYGFIYTAKKKKILGNMWMSFCAILWLWLTKLGGFHVQKTLFKRLSLLIHFCFSNKLQIPLSSISHPLEVLVPLKNQTRQANDFSLFAHSFVLTATNHTLSQHLVWI